MAELGVTLCGRTVTISCADGEEGRLQALIAMIERRAEDARSIVGDDSWRQLLFAALFLADELDAKPGESQPAAPRDDDRHFSDIADRVERLAARLEAIAGAGLEPEVRHA